MEASRSKWSPDCLVQQNCPPKKEAGRSPQAGTGQALAKKVFGKVIQVDDLGKDRYGRTLGIVRLGKRNINLELVQEGWAWWYRKYAPKNKELAKAEAEARKAKRGLWADPKPVPP